MKRVVMCEVAWMKYYAGINEDDKPMGGGAYIKKNGTGGEIWNFSPYNHLCYGYVMHYGDELHLERLKDVSRNDATAEDITVVWVATDGKASKIIGFFEHATMFRYWQTKFDSTIDIGSWDYNFTAKVSDCYLVPEEKRSFIIPRATVEGVGKGMGESQLWYCESAYAQTSLIPKVLDYLETVKPDCLALEPDAYTLSAPSEDTGLSVEALIEKAYEAIDEQNPVEALQTANRALLSEDSAEVRSCRADCFASMFFYDEAETELEFALRIEPDSIKLIHSLLYVSLMREDYDKAILLGEKLRARRTEEEADWSNAAANLYAAYMMKHSPKIRDFIRECKDENSIYHFKFLEEALDALTRITF